MSGEGKREGREGEVMRYRVAVMMNSGWHRLVVIHTVTFNDELKHVSYDLALYYIFQFD